eukprot:3796783-Amphidinium_carterae.1
MIANTFAALQSGGRFSEAGQVEPTPFYFAFQCLAVSASRSLDGASPRPRLHDTLMLRDGLNQ